MIAFWTISALLAVTALLFVVLPLFACHPHVRSSRRDANLAVYRDQLREIDADLAAGALHAEQHAKARRELQARLLGDMTVDDAVGSPVRHGRGAAIIVSIAVPLLVFGLYFAVGNPQALRSGATADADAAHGMTAQQVELLVERLAARMRENPDNPEGWILLGRSYGTLSRFDQAAQAYANAAARLPRDAQLLADYADVLAMAQGRRLQGEPEKILARALEADPNNLKAHALAGTAAFEKPDYAGAVGHWEQMLPLVPQDSDTTRSIQANIAEARSLGGTAPTNARRERGSKQDLNAANTQDEGER